VKTSEEIDALYRRCCRVRSLSSALIAEVVNPAVLTGIILKRFQIRIIFQMIWYRNPF